MKKVFISVVITVCFITCVGPGLGFIFNVGQLVIADEKKEQSFTQLVDCVNENEKIEKYSLHQVELNILRATNRERTRRGLQPLKPHIVLIEDSRNHCIWMINKRRLEHGKGPFAENIARGYETSKGVVAGWMNSKGHRANILNSRYRYIGVSAYISTNTGVVWWCQRFK